MRIILTVPEKKHLLTAFTHYVAVSFGMELVGLSSRTSGMNSRTLVPLRPRGSPHGADLLICLISEIAKTSILETTHIV